MKTYFISFTYDNGASREKYSSIVLAENVNKAREQFLNFCNRAYPSSDDDCTIDIIFEIRDKVMIIEGERRLTPRTAL